MRRSILIGLLALSGTLALKVRAKVIPPHIAQRLEPSLVYAAAALTVDQCRVPLATGR